MLWVCIAFSICTSCKKESRSLEVQLLYKNAKNGETLLGSKENVIKAIREGADIKIGWQSVGKTRKIEHLSSPIWLAILNEKEVVAYLDPQIFADTDWKNLSASYEDYENLYVEWRVVLTTSGNFDAVWYNRKSDSVVRRVPQNHEMTWFARF
ncbi:hypothetical protein [Croceitalea marina]|uniref:hypothetical protein n=1 Tax=Croceitalea marina TaxID=1775166 RepID=UPI0036721226